MDVMGPNNTSVVETDQNQDVAAMKNKGRTKPMLQDSQQCHRSQEAVKYMLHGVPYET